MGLSPCARRGGGSRRAARPPGRPLPGRSAGARLSPRPAGLSPLPPSFPPSGTGDSGTGASPAVVNPLRHRVRGCRGGRCSDASAERHRPPNNPPVCRAPSPPLPAALAFPGAAPSSPAVLPREGAKPTLGTGRPVPYGGAAGGVGAPRVLPGPGGVCETAGGG